LEQQLEDRRLEYEGVSAELQRLRRDRADFHDEIRAAEVGIQRQQDEVAQREGVIARLTDQVDKMRGDSINQRIKMDDLRNQRTALRKTLQELRATMEDRDLRIEELRVMLDNRNEEVAAMEERVTHTREARDSLQLHYNENLSRLGTLQQELVGLYRRPLELKKQRHSKTDRSQHFVRSNFRRTGRSRLSVGSSTPARPRHAKLTRDSRCRWRFSDNSCCHPRPPRPLLRAICIDH
jgi:chromosome segregation ATPase